MAALIAATLAIPRSWYRAQKPLKPGNTKKIRKSHEIPHPGSDTENKKKIQKKYKNGDFRPIFVFFLYFFRIFGARPGVGDFVTFSYFFRISGLEGFLSSIPGTRNRNATLFATTVSGSQISENQEQGVLEGGCFLCFLGHDTGLCRNPLC